MFLLQHLRWPSLEILSYPGFHEVRCGTAQMTSLENMFWGGSTAIVYGSLAKPMILHFFFRISNFQPDSLKSWLGYWMLLGFHWLHLIFIDLCGCEVVLYIRSGSNESVILGEELRMMYIPTQWPLGAPKWPNIAA